MHLGVMLAVGDRQHGNVGLGVFLFAVDGQRPEVWRCPRENDQHQQQRFGTDMAGYCNPAKQRRRSTREAANHDVLWRGALEKAGVKHRIPEQGSQRQPGGQLIGKR